MRAHIHPIFVFDGPSRPWKRGRKGGQRVNYERTRLLEQLLDRMRIPHHRAPGEAEAECARMQQIGVVDAVWSDDADSLMFGADVLIKDHRERQSKTAKHEDLVQVYRASEIREKHGLDAKAIVAYVTLVGGDYDTKGLLNCGEETVNKLAAEGHLRALGRTLCAAQSERDLFVFRQELMHALAEVRKRIPVPADFPTWRAVKNYKNPKVSSAEQLEDLKIRKTWDKEINHDKLREILRDRFNIWTKGYCKYIAPMLLLRELAATESGQEHKNNNFDISVVKKRRKAGGAQDLNPQDIKILFRPLATMPTVSPNQPPGEDWRELATKDGPFDPLEHIELQTLRCLVARGKGEALLEAEIIASEVTVTKGSKKRKSNEPPSVDNEGECQPKTKKAGRPRKQNEVQSEASIERARKRRMKRREEYNTSKGHDAGSNMTNKNSETAPSVASNNRNSKEVCKPSSVVQTLGSVASIDLTLSDDDSRSPHKAVNQGFRQPRALNVSSHLQTVAEAVQETRHNQLAPAVQQTPYNRPFTEQTSAAEHLDFEADVLESIQKSLIKSGMLQDPMPRAPRAALEPMSTNVRVASEAAKALLLSPRSAVRQRWASAAATSKEPQVQPEPAVIDLTTS